MQIELLEPTDVFDSPTELDPISDEEPKEVEPSYETEGYVLWHGHFITPHAFFEKLENLALNADPKTAGKIQDLVERLARASSEGISETNRLLLLRDIELLSGGTDKGNVDFQCCKKKNWVGNVAHKVAKFVKKHKVAIIVGIVVVAAIITVAVLVSGTAAEGIGMATGAGGAMAGSGDDKKAPEEGPTPPPVEPDPIDDAPSPTADEKPDEGTTPPPVDPDPVDDDPSPTADEKPDEGTTPPPVDPDPVDDAPSPTADEKPDEGTTPPPVDPDPVDDDPFIADTQIPTSPPSSEPTPGETTESVLINPFFEPNPSMDTPTWAMPERELPRIGSENQGVIYMHCGINNNADSITAGGTTLYNELKESFAIQPDLTHNDGLVHGAAMVLLEKIGQPSLISAAVQGPVLMAMEQAFLNNSSVQESIMHRAEELTVKAEQILRSGNPNLKQVHVAFSNGGYVLNEALKILPPEYRQTVVVVTAGTTKIIDKESACKVYNLVGTKDWPCKVCNGGDAGIERAAKNADIKAIDQTETRSFIGGHYLTQPEYLKGISNIIKNEVAKDMRLAINVRLVKFFIACNLVFFFSSCEKKNVDISELCSEYKLIKVFSNRIEPETGLVLFSYGFNNNLPKNYQFKNGVANFSADYTAHKTQKDIVSLEEARRLVVSVAESLLEEINSNPTVRPNLDVYPMTSDLLTISIDFEDENGIELGNGGVSEIYFSHGKIKYERYEIYEYTNRCQLPEGVNVTEEINGKIHTYQVKNSPKPPGKNFPVHQESYADALDIVKKENGLKHL